MDCSHACVFRWATRKEEGNGEHSPGRHPAPSSPINRPREIKLPDPRLPGQKTSLRAARTRPWPPTTPPQTAAPASTPARFTLDHAAQRLAAQHTTETPRVVRRTGSKQHITSRPVAGTQRNFFAFFEQPLTLARGEAALSWWDAALSWRRNRGRKRCAARRTCLAALAITACLLLAVLPALAACPVLLLGMPTLPMFGCLPALVRTIPTLRTNRPKPLFTILEQTTTQLSPGWPLRWTGYIRQ